MCLVLDELKGFFTKCVAPLLLVWFELIVGPGWA